MMEKIRKKSAVDGAADRTRDRVVTVKSGSTTTGTVTVKTKDVIFLRKETAETVEVGSGIAGVKAVSCKFSH